MILTEMPRAPALSPDNASALPSPLHRRVGSRARLGKTGQSAGDVKDPSAVVKQRQQALGQEERSFEMNVQRLIKLGFRRVGVGRI